MEDKLNKLKAVLVEEYDAVGVQMEEANAMDRYMSLLHYRNGIAFSIDALNANLEKTIIFSYEVN